MSILPKALDAMTRGLAYRASFIIVDFAWEFRIPFIKGPEIIMLTISTRMRAYEKTDEAKTFRRNSKEDAKPITADAKASIKITIFAHMRRHI